MSLRIIAERCSRCNVEYNQPLHFEDEEREEDVWACPNCNYIYPLGLSISY